MNSTGRLQVGSDARFDGIQVFSATMVAKRDQLGEEITEWIASHPELVVTEFVVSQSSDASFHCVSICVFFRTKTAPASPTAERPARTRSRRV
ncbi:MAG: hypothetical protein QM831_43965 [Kofleriaceae bacterium]